MYHYKHLDWHYLGWSPDTAVMEALVLELGERVGLAWDDEQVCGWQPSLLLWWLTG